MKRYSVLMILTAICRLNAWCQPTDIKSVFNAATFQSGLPAGGGLATAYCPTYNAKPGIYVASTTSPLPFELGGLRVNINDGNAPILAVIIPPPGESQYAQVNFQVPQERNSSIIVAQGSPGFMTCGNGLMSPLPALPSWGGFFSDANGYAVAQHASDFSQVTTDNPAHPGETIIAYADDFFPVWPPPPVGFPVPPQPQFKARSPKDTNIRDPGLLYLQAYPLTVNNIGGPNTPPLVVTFAGLAPGQVGVEQINFVVPDDQQPGDWALFYNMRFATQPFKSVSSPFVKLPVR